MSGPWIKFTWAVGLIGLAIGAMLTFFEFTTRRDIRRRVEAEVGTKVEEMVSVRAEKLIAEAEKSLTEKIEVVEHEANQLSDQIGRLRENYVSDTARSAQLKETADYKGKSVVWVDDQPDPTTLAMREELKKLGIKVTAVGSTPELMKLLAHSQTDEYFDLIISDMQRGSNDREGLDLFEMIKGQDHLPDRLIFTANSCLQALGPKVQQELQQLRDDDKRFLGAVTSTDPFFRTIFDALRKAPQKQ